MLHPTITITHPAWDNTLRLVASHQDETLEGVVYVADPALSVPTPQMDDTGRVSVAIAIGNDGGMHTARFALLRGSTARPYAELRWYVDGVLDTGPVVLEMHEPRAVGAVIEAQLRSENDEDKPAHMMAFTLENTPTIRGLK